MITPGIQNPESRGPSKQAATIARPKTNALACKKRMTQESLLLPHVTVLVGLYVKVGHLSKPQLPPARVHLLQRSWKITPGFQNPKTLSNELLQQRIYLKSHVRCADSQSQLSRLVQLLLAIGLSFSGQNGRVE